MSPLRGLAVWGWRFYKHTEETPQQKSPTGLRMDASMSIFYELYLCEKL